MSDQLEVLIHWEIGELEDQLENFKKDLHSLMIDRNTAALRVIALENAGVPYPSDIDSLEVIDKRVGDLVQKIQSTQNQLAAWSSLLQNLSDPQVQLQVGPMIRTVELQQKTDEGQF